MGLPGEPGPPISATDPFLTPSRPLTDPLAGKQDSPPTTLRSVFRVVFAAPEASKRPFCALELPTVFRTRFWRSPESILGAILASKMVICDHVVPGPVDSFVELISHRCLLRVPSEICLLRALREKGTCGLRPTKTNGISCFLYMRGAAGHAARKATEDNI